MNFILHQLAAKKLKDINHLDITRDQLVAIITPEKDFDRKEIAHLAPKDVLIMKRNGPEIPKRLDDRVMMNYRKQRNIRENNCEIAILHGHSIRSILYRKTLTRFSKILIPLGAGNLTLLYALARFRRRNRLKLIGVTQILRNHGAVKYLVLETNLKTNDNRRQYATAGLSPLEIIHSLQGINYVVLRWGNLIADGTHSGDIDMLVSSETVDEIPLRFSESVATNPLDVYTEDSSKGYYFMNVPYIYPPFAKRILDNAIEINYGIRVPPADLQYLSYAYHLLFHIKTRRIPPGTENLSEGIYPHPKYYRELTRLAKQAGFKPPLTFDDIERDLKENDAFPSIDLIGFYANKNKFLKHRYFSNSRYRPGLTTVFVRDFGKGDTDIINIRTHLQKKFRILEEGAVTNENSQIIMGQVRGGNWADPEAPEGIAPPIHWFACFDDSPVKPSRRTRKRYPRVDNENIMRKHAIREQIGEKTRKPQRIIHASDNTREAIEHLELLGLSESPDIKKIIGELKSA